MTEKRHRAFMITDNQCETKKKLITKLNRVEIKYPKTKYIIGVCEENGGTKNHNPHSHAFVYFSNAIKMSSLKKIWEDNPHIDHKDGNESDRCNAIDYIKNKSYEVIERGERPKTKKEIGEDEANKWTEAWDLAKKGQIEMIDPKIRLGHYSNLRRISAEIPSMPHFEPDVDITTRFFYIWGPTGTGKTHVAHELAKLINPNEEPYLKIPNNKWWDGYKGQTVVIIDEVPTGMSTELKNFYKIWVNNKAFPAEVKGGNMPGIRPPYIIMTSNHSMMQVWGKEIQGIMEDTEDSLAMERRCSVILKNDKYISPIAPKKFTTLEDAREYLAQKAVTEILPERSETPELLELLEEPKVDEPLIWDPDADSLTQYLQAKEIEKKIKENPSLFGSNPYLQEWEGCYGDEF